MGLWSKIGLVNRKELEQFKEGIILEQVVFRKEIQELFQVQRAILENGFETLNNNSMDAFNRLLTKNEAEDLVIQINELEGRLSHQIDNLKEEVREISDNVALIQEIAKVHWASTLLDYVDELLNEEAQNQKVIETKSSPKSFMSNLPSIYKGNRNY